MSFIQSAAGWVLFLALATGSGCASKPAITEQSASLFNDQYFKPQKKPFNSESVFELSPEMHNYLRNEGISSLRSIGRAKTLLYSLYSRDKLQLEYDSTYTRTAREAFDAKSGNCLSLVLMTASFAKEMGLPIRYQSVYTPENISRSEGVVYYSDHVNLLLGQVDVNMVMVNANESLLLVDFLAPDQTTGLRTITISEKTILAMYMNNRAAEELHAKNLDEAYWWAKRGIENDPVFLATYNTLGLIYLRRGLPAEAEKAFRYILNIEPANYAALANLAHLVRKQGNVQEAERLGQQLRSIKPTPPFYYFDIGMQAMRAKDYQKARDNFQLEVNRSAFNPEFNYWLAGAYIGLNDRVNARKYLIVAHDNATTADDRKLYESKLKEVQPPRK
jgi:hypothetical protein